MICFSHSYQNIPIKTSLYQNNHIKTSGSPAWDCGKSSVIAGTEIYSKNSNDDNPKSPSVSWINLNPFCLSENGPTPRSRAEVPCGFQTQNPSYQPLVTVVGGHSLTHRQNPGKGALEWAMKNSKRLSLSF